MDSVHVARVAAGVDCPLPVPGFKAGLNTDQVFAAAHVDFAAPLAIAQKVAQVEPQIVGLRFTHVTDDLPWRPSAINVLLCSTDPHRIDPA